MRSALVLLVLVVFAAPAAAHVSAFTEAQNLLAGDWTIFVDPKPAPIYEGAAFNWSVYVGEGALAVPVKEARVTIRVERGPAHVGHAWTLHALPRAGEHLAPARLEEAGAYNVSVHVATQNETRQANATFRIWSDLGARIAMADPNFDAFANETKDVQFVTVDRAGQRLDAFPSLTVRFEHWDDTHRVLRGFEERELTRTGVGTWSTSYGFPWRGMYHMSFASESFGFNDTPILHLTAIQAYDFGDDDGDRDMPLPALLAVLALGGAAKAFTTFARRSRRR